MKKVLSMVLALALVLTTLVVPMTVSAANGDVTISYKISAVDKDLNTRENGEIYVGDTVTVKVMATGNKLMKGYEVYIPYTGIEVDANIKFEYASAKYVKFISPDDVTVTEEGIEIGQFTFTAPAAGDYSINAVSADLSYFGDGWDLCTFASEAKSYKVFAHTGAVSITGEGVNVQLNDTTTSGSASTLTATPLTVAISSPTNSDITEATLNNEAIVDNTATIDAYGEYAIKFKTQDGVEHSYSFIYKTSTQIDVVARIDNANGFTPGNTVALKILVDGLSDSVVEGLTFGIKYDTAAFTIGAAPENVEITAGADEVTNNISWFIPEDGTGISGASEQEAFTLTFTVNDGYKVAGTKMFELVNEQAAVNGFNADAAAVAPAGTNDKAYATIHNGANTFEVTDPSTEWATEKTGKVVFAEGWTGEAVVKYAVFADVQSSDASTIFAGALDVAEDGTITVDEAKYYYIVAQFGTEGNYVYQIVDTWAADAVKIDKILPTATVEELANWANNASRPTITINVADAESGVKEVKYNFDGSENWFDAAYTADEPTATVTLPAEDVVIAKIYVKAIDNVDNASEDASYTINYDNKKPVISDLTAGTFDGEGVEITGILTDEGGASKAPTEVTVWIGDTQQANATLTDGAISFKATSNATYTFKATDGAGNVGTAEIEVTNAVSESVFVAPTFQVVKDGATGSFKTADELADLGLETNGTFTYVKMIPGEYTPAFEGDTKGDKLTTTFKLQKDGEEEATVETVVKDAANAEDKGSYTLVVTTIYDGNANDAKTETYKFSIAGAYDNEFMTVSGDNKYRVNDYRIMDLLVDENATDETFKATVTVDDNMLWKGGYFAGDVDGSLEAADWVADAATMLAEMRTAKAWAQYQFALFNNLPIVEE